MALLHTAEFHRADVHRADGNGAGAELTVPTPLPAADRSRADDPGFGHLGATEAKAPGVVSVNPRVKDNP